MILTDYEYSGVLCKFPKFRKGIIKEDWQLACDEYKRYYTTPGGQRKPLEKRNTEFCCNFLAEHGCDCGTNSQGQSFCNSDNDYGFP